MGLARNPAAGRLSNMRYDGLTQRLTRRLNCAKADEDSHHWDHSNPLSAYIIYMSGAACITFDKAGTEARKCSEQCHTKYVLASHPQWLYQHSDRMPDITFDSEGEDCPCKSVYKRFVYSRPCGDLQFDGKLLMH